MARFQRFMLAASVVVAVGLVAGVAIFLVHADRSARDNLRGGFEARSALAATLTSAAVINKSEVNVKWAQDKLGGPAAGLPAAVAAVAVAEPQDRILVLGADRRVLGAHPASARTDPALVGGSEIDRALEGSQGVSDLIRTAEGQLILMVAVPYSTAEGLRVWSSSVAAEPVAMFCAAYLANALAVDGGRAFLVDSHGQLIASSSPEDKTGAQVPDPVAAAATRSPSGTLGGDFYAASVVAGTSWRVIFAAPDRSVLAPLRSSRTATWQLFAGFVLAMLCILGLAAAAIRRSAQLAHERLHDPLTGLPNRALFVQQAERALGRQRRSGGQLAALFIDLDRFKPVNDIYGHAVGDALLAAVAVRLTETARRDDVVSRFGGDEFLVLCSDIDDQDQALAVADRVQQRLAEPFLVDGHELTIGSSIGLMHYAVQDEYLTAAELIHNADLAMYQAKQGGRGRVECFEPVLAA